jgi:hypothetical protein
MGLYRGVHHIDKPVVMLKLPMTGVLLRVICELFAKRGTGLRVRLVAPIMDSNGRSKTR